jgi:hypothetical protein
MTPPTSQKQTPQAFLVYPVPRRAEVNEHMFVGARRQC